jgi:hypothetical protein
MGPALCAAAAEAELAAGVAAEAAGAVGAAEVVAAAGPQPRKSPAAAALSVRANLATLPRQPASLHPSFVVRPARARPLPPAPPFRAAASVALAERQRALQ